MPKISSYAENNDPDGEFEFLGTDPVDSSMGPTGTTETVPLTAILAQVPAASSSQAGLVQLAGDLGGTSASPQVRKIQGTTVATPSGGSTYYLNAAGNWTQPAGGGGGGGASVWHDLVETYGADPTGGTSASTALATACTAAVAAQPQPFGLTVPPGTFLLTASQDLPWNMILQGSGVNGGDVTGQYGGTWFRLSSSFSGSYAFGFKDVPAPTTYTGVNGCLASGFGIDGAAQGGTAVNGFYLVGPTMCTFSDIIIAQMSGWGVLTAEDTSANEIGPFGQVWNNVTADSNGTVSGGGFYLQWCEDSIFINVYSIGNNSGDGFTITACDNTKFSTCNAEWNVGGHGWHITGDWQWATGGCMFSNISTDANSHDGVHIDATWTTGGGAGTGPCVILMNGVFNRRDGAGTAPGTGTYAGISIGATTLPIVINGFAQMTNIGDNGAGSMSPRYGIFFSQSTYSGAIPNGQPILISNGIAWGYSNPVFYAGASGSGFPTGVTNSSVLLAHGNNYSPTYGS